MPVPYENKMYTSSKAYLYVLWSYAVMQLWHSSKFFDNRFEMASARKLFFQKLLAYFLFIEVTVAARKKIINGAEPTSMVVMLLAMALAKR